MLLMVLYYRRSVRPSWSRTISSDGCASLPPSATPRCPPWSVRRSRRKCGPTARVPAV